MCHVLVAATLLDLLQILRTHDRSLMQSWIFVYSPVFDILFRKCRPPGRLRLQRKFVGPAGRHLLATSATGLATGMRRLGDRTDSVTVRRDWYTGAGPMRRDSTGIDVRQVRPRASYPAEVAGTTALCFTILGNIHAEKVIYVRARNTSAPLRTQESASRSLNHSYLLHLGAMP
jgi:hypothetical protein